MAGLSLAVHPLAEDGVGAPEAGALECLVAEFFAVKAGMIAEIHAVLVNLDDAEPTGWEPEYGPGRGGR